MILSISICVLILYSAFKYLPLSIPIPKNYLTYSFLEKNLKGVDIFGTFLIAIVGICLLWWRAKSADKQVDTAQRVHLTDLFSKAVELIGQSGDDIAKTGGIFALEKVAKEDAKIYHVVVYELLCAFIRKHSSLDTQNGKKGRTEPSLIVQTALTVIGRRNEKPDVKLDLRGVNLPRVNLTDANLTDVNLANSNLSCANLTDVNFTYANLIGTNLTDTNLKGANFAYANLKFTKFKNAKFNNVSILKSNSIILRFDKSNLSEYQIAKFQDTNFQFTNFQKADLQGIDFRDANLQFTNFQKADLQGIDFRDANLQDVNFQKADLQDANFQGASLYGADLRDTNLQYANFQSAILWYANFKNTDFQNINILNANIDDTNFDGVKNLTKEQIMKAYWNEKPKGLEFNVPEENPQSPTQE